PTARARSFIKPGHWNDAEAAFAEVVNARPFDGTILLERAQYYLDRSQPEKADADLARAYALGAADQKSTDRILGSEALFRRVIAEVPERAAWLWARRGEEHARQGRMSEAATDYGQAVRLKPGDPDDWTPRIVALMAAGDGPGLRRACSELLDRFGKTDDPVSAKRVAWVCSLAPDAVPHRHAPVRPAPFALPL